MSMKYSPSLDRFYNQDWQINMPEDSVDVTDEQYAEMVSEGKGHGVSPEDSEALAEPEELAPVLRYSPSTAGYYNSAFPIAAPGDAFEISAEQYAAIKASGMTLKPQLDGDEVTLVDSQAPLTNSQLAFSQILELEASITPRRLRDAILGTDEGWLAGVEAQIETLRAAL